MIEPDIKASCAVAGPTAWGIETHKSKKRVIHAKEIMSTEEFRLARFGRIHGNSSRIIWREDGSMFTEKGIPYIPKEGEVELPLDVEMPEMCWREGWHSFSSILCPQ